MGTITKPTEQDVSRANWENVLEGEYHLARRPGTVPAPQLPPGEGEEVRSGISPLLTVAFLLEALIGLGIGLLWISVWATEGIAVGLLTFMLVSVPLLSWMVRRFAPDPEPDPAPEPCGYHDS